MDVPFISSGALSRAHYALVRKVETTASVPAADQALLAEIEEIHASLTGSALSEKRTKECLIRLLYCSMTLSPGVSVNIDFALPHAVNMAEAGQTVQNKRTGYMYCTEMMPQGHELQLMLVNTLRKDLESSSVSRICLALDALIQSPSEDVIPAVQDRLHDLLSHNSPHVRRRTLFAFRALSRFHPSILEHVADKINQRLRDHDPPVAVAALTLSVSLIETGLLSADRLRGSIARLLEETWRSRRTPHNRSLLLKIIEVFRILRPSLSVCESLLEIIQACAKYKPSGNVILEQCFLAVASAETSDLIKAQTSLKISFVHNIRRLLVAQDMNEVYLFITCLGCVNTKLWAGNTSDIPAVLEGWEVDRVMQLLDSADHSIRRKTLRILANIGVNIVESYYKQLIQMDRAAATEEELTEAAKRLVEIIDTLYADNGEAYAHALRDIISSLPTPQSAQEKQKILQEVVEDVLTLLREASSDFKSSLLGVMFALLDTSDEALGPTITVVVSALVCEYLGSSPVPPSRLLQGLSRQLPLYNAAIQDACLLSMIRTIASCDDVPESSLATVRKIQEQSGRHIRRRCEQFLNLSQSRTIVQHIISRSKSSTLPDFLISLEAYEVEKLAQVTQSPSLSAVASPERPSSRASSRASHAPGQLRYTAYDTPQAAPRLRRAHPASPTLSASSRFIGEDYEANESLSRTITAGDLAIASAQIELQNLNKSVTRVPQKSPSTLATIEDDLASRVDLITLDSPFIVDPFTPSSARTEVDFKATWDKLLKANMRGWCESPVKDIIEKLQAAQPSLQVISVEQPPFEGDVKIIIPDKADQSQLGRVALLRLKIGEDDSCMWQLRCDDPAFRDPIGAILRDP